MSVEIRTLAEGEVITEPGAYRMSMERYHTQEVCDGPSVSSTDLRRAYSSLHAFWKGWRGNPNRYPDKPPSDSLILGRAAHCLVLGDEVFDEQFCYVPEDAPRRPTAAQVNAFHRDGKWSDAAAEGAAWWAKFDAKSQGKEEVTQAQVQKILYMAENLNANKLCVELLRSDLTEISMVWQDEATGLWIKSRPDCMPANGYDFGDLKTFAPKSTNLILAAQRSVTDYDYPMQMALATMGAEILFGQTAKNCGLCFTMTADPYEAIPVLLDYDTLYWAKVRCRDAINRIAEGLQTNEWPGVGRELITYSYPPSMTEKMSDMQSSGQLPSM